MQRFLVGLVLAVGFGLAAPGLAKATRSSDAKLQEVIIGTGDVPLAVPPEYGRLVNVAVSSEVHHLYFEDAKGTIRIVLLGPAGAVQKARHGFQLLVPEVYLINRQHSSSAAD